MHRGYRSKAQLIYADARQALIERPEALIELERVVTRQVKVILQSIMATVVNDYNAASIVYPFWQAYPPLERGRQPIGDQFPWIEVGEHTIGTSLARALAVEFQGVDMGFPSGADQRLILRSDLFAKASGLTDIVWLNLDIKSVGPRDNFDHAVMSHNQISGSGIWTDARDHVENGPMVAVGPSASHAFYPALPPLIVTPEFELAPTITVALKPLYSMLPPPPEGGWTGQPLDRVGLATIPNGLLLTEGPCYLKSHPGLLFPGKDDKGKDPRKLRARVSFDKLRKIAEWRHQNVWSAP